MRENGNSFTVQQAYTLLCTCRLKASHYFVQGFDANASNFFKRNKNQTIKHMTEILQDLTVSTVKASKKLINATGLCRPITRAQSMLVGAE